MEKFNSALKASRISFLIKPCLILFALFISFSVFGQVDLSDGQAAIEDAAVGIGDYFEPIKTVVFVIAGIIALIGAIRVYTKWQMGDPDVMSTAASWFGSAVFLIVAVTIIQGIFVVT